MRTAEIDYDLEIGGFRLLLTVNFEIEFETEGRGTEDPRVITRARPVSIQTMVGGMPFAMVKWADVSKDYPLYYWIQARCTEVTPEACGYTTEEAIREAYDDEDENAYWQAQIGKPL